MPDSKRYDENTIAEIFRQAAEAQAEARDRASRPDGLTLEELEEIGRESGLDPEFIRSAAVRMQTKPRVEDPPQLLGIDIGVARTIELPRRMTGMEWHALVGDLRQTFKAKGKLHESDAFREWSNGNLHIMVEPSGDRHRLRMRTLKGLARELMVGGGTLTAMALIGALILLITGSAGQEMVMLPALLILMGFAMAAAGYAQVPGWARTRGRQMEEIGQRVVERMVTGSEPSGSGVGSADDLEFRESAAADPDGDRLGILDPEEPIPAMAPRRTRIRD